MSLEKTLSYHFLQKTNLSWNNLGVREIYLEPAPAFKEYKGAERIALKVDKFPATENFFTILSKRRSQRKYNRKPLSLEELSLLCFSV
ncbi:MAG: SagB/ThcOx family dehydrogenase, partial [Caldimicrobium sp.]